MGLLVVMVLGLDAWVGRVGRVSDEDVRFMSCRFMNCAPANMVFVTDDMALSDGVSAFVREFETYSRDFDWALLRQDMSVPDDWVVRSYAVRSDGIHIEYAEHLRSQEHPESMGFDVSNYDVEHRYETIARVRCKAFLFDEVACWREGRRVREIVRTRGSVEDGGYHDLDVAQLRAIVGLGHDGTGDEALSASVVDDAIGGAVYAYHEWR